MYYNVEFFFEEPMRLFITQEETEYTIPQEDYEKYSSGEYIKGDDGRPLKRNNINISDGEIIVAAKSFPNLDVTVLNAIKEMSARIEGIENAIVTPEEDEV